tara:strand:+ start:522 stop:647 length:126 start_codon:yes stop_codon:yes gene_type:complete
MGISMVDKFDTFTLEALRKIRGKDLKPVPKPDEPKKKAKKR